MRLHYTIFADAAEVAQSGKLGMLGGNVDVLRLPTFPALVSPLVAVISVDVDVAEADSLHQVYLELISPVGQNLLPKQVAAFSPLSNSPESAELPLRYLFIANLGGLIVPAAGMHWLRIVVDDAEVGKVPLLVLNAPTLEEPGANQRER